MSGNYAFQHFWHREEMMYSSRSNSEGTPWGIDPPTSSRFFKICSLLSTKVDVCLADHDPSSNGGKINILIGSDYYREIVTG